jgi:hypothetical protein
MKVETEIQKNDTNTIYEYINNQLESNPKKSYFFCGCVKEPGFNILEESIIDIKTKLTFVIGIDKKNTTKNMLELMLKYADEVYVYNNNDLYEYDSNTVIFEYTDKAVFLVANSNISEGGLKDNISFYTTIEYDLTNKEEKESYKLNLKKLLSQIDGNGFEKLTKNVIEKLVEDKQIFSIKQYIHNVKSISELLEEKKDASKTIEKDETNTPEDDVIGGVGIVPKIDLSDISMDNLEIEIPEEESFVVPEEVVEKKPSSKNNKKSEESEINYDSESLKDYDINDEKLTDFVDEDFNEIDKNNELYDEELASIEFNENETLDIENMLFSKSNMRLDATESRKNKKVEKVSEKKENEIVQTKKVDLDNISNLLFELPEKSVKDQEASCIKIPNYIKDMIPNFFEINENSSNIEINGVMSKVRNIKIEVVDVKESKKYLDREAKIIQKNGQTHINIFSDMLKNVQYLESDIVRIIKLSSDTYHIEFISSQIQEYKLWSKLCTQTLKSTTRKYGMM